MIESEDPRVGELLKSLGMPDHCVKFVLTAQVDQPLIAEATFYVDPDGGGLLSLAKRRYKFVELELDPLAISAVEP